MAHSRKLILMIGESGSGKSTVAKAMVDKNPEKYVSISRDNLRIELRKEPDCPKGEGFEPHVKKVQMARAAKFLKEDKNVIIDDTNIHPQTRLNWEKFAEHKAEFAPYRVFTSMEDCIARDAQRTGSAHVGIAVIHRQFLLSKRIIIDPDKPVVICDLDGTLADSTGVRNVYDESQVGKDKIVPFVRDWINALAEDHTILIVSGRKSTCGDASAEWMRHNEAKLDYIFMRHSYDVNKPDTVIKQGILDEILGVIPKHQIAFVIDDRPKVCKMWKENGLTVYPVRGTTDHRIDCTYEMTKNDERCPDCWALADF